MAVIIEQIRSAWEGVLTNRATLNGTQAHVHHDIQDVAFIVSQLIEPTIAIIAQFATLYVVIKKNGKKTCSHEREIERERAIIKEILDNYNVDIGNVDEAIDSIITSLKGKD